MKGQSLVTTEMICSVSFFYLPILSVIMDSESFRRSISFLFSYFKVLIFSSKERSRSLISLARRVERFSMREL